MDIATNASADALKYSMIDCCYKENCIYRYIGYTQKLALLLDYDGTLAPIAPHPDLATLPLETKNTLQRLSNMPDVNIAIVSGRNVDNVQKMVIIFKYIHLNKSTLSDCLSKVQLTT